MRQENVVLFSLSWGLKTLRGGFDAGEGRGISEILDRERALCQYYYIETPDIESIEFLQRRTRSNIVALSQASNPYMSHKLYLPRQNSNNHPLHSPAVLPRDLLEELKKRALPAVIPILRVALGSLFSQAIFLLASHNSFVFVGGGLRCGVNVGDGSRRQARLIFVVPKEENLFDEEG